jgi:hypothetical protein
MKTGLLDTAAPSSLLENSEREDDHNIAVCLCAEVCSAAARRNH